MENDIQLVACTLDAEEYGVDISYVQEIIRLLDITRVPHAPYFIEGVINLRGMVIPVLDLRTLFRKTPRVNTDATRIIIINSESVLLGIIVDQVSEVVTLPKTSVEPPPAVGNTHNSTYFTGVGKLLGRLVILLNVEEILKAVTKQ